MRLQTIELLLRLARQAEDRARVEAGARRKAFNDAVRLGDALTHYTDDYRNRFLAAGIRGAEVHDLIAQDAFRSRMLATRNGQLQTIETRRLEADQALVSVQANRRRTKIVETLAKKARDTERRRLDRIEQAIADDLVNSRQRPEGTGTDSA